ncbi:MAG: Asp-tRNA(Asn)/Glu-tRNA(Gln) amidotransferase subunit GatC [bacterium]|nr:Asp-tRNA(Asn)/Glu-tRNA(Gln) amidotransferase subunit GatC [bacterium]
MTDASSITVEDIKKLASLAQLYLSDTELDAYASQLVAIFGFISKLMNVVKDERLKTDERSDLHDIFREDTIDTSRMLTQAQALSGVKTTHEGYFVVPAVFSEIKP